MAPRFLDMQEHEGCALARQLLKRTPRREAIEQRRAGEESPAIIKPR